MTMNPVMNKRFDLSGAEISRVGKHAIISKFARFEDFCGGPGWQYLLIAFFMHHSAWIWARVLIHFEKQVNSFLESKLFEKLFKHLK